MISEKKIHWTTSDQPVDYPQAEKTMLDHVNLLKKADGPEKIWLLEHPPLYTAGTSAKPNDLLNAGDFPVFETGRGGQFTYHGPGQRVAYVMIDLNQREKDLRRYVSSLEQWIINTLHFFDVEGFRHEGRVGIWVESPDKTGQIREEKIAAIGVRISQWITYHGIAINLNPNLDHYEGIVPCGLPQFGMTSLHKLGKKVSMNDLDEALKKAWEKNEFLNLRTD